MAIRTLRTQLLISVALLVAAVPPLKSTAQEAIDIFELSATSLDKDAAGRLASDLVDFARGKCRAAPDYCVGSEYRKLVRVAYQLAPDNQNVLSAHARIKKGLAPEPPKKSVSPEALMAALLPLANKAQDGKSAHDLTVARYLYAAGLMIDPQNDTCIVSWERLNKRGGDIPWAKVLAVYLRDVPDGHTRSINGLVVSTVGATQVGQISRILLTYRKEGQSDKPDQLDVTFLREDGSQMVTSMDEAIRYWDRLRNGVPLPTGTLEISFEDKFTSKDGPSAGAAYAVLMRSFSDPFDIDSAFAMTGDVSVEGRILKIGGAFAKIRGAVLGKCTRVGIPLSNEDELAEAIMLNGPATLTEIEIYGMDTIERAVALARTDRDESVEKATALFAGLPSLVQKKLSNNFDSKPSPDIQEITGKILALRPQHLSAKLIDAWNNRKLPATLSLASSLYETSNVFYKYLVTISPKLEPDLDDIAKETKPTNINAAMKNLHDLKPKLHTDAQKPAKKLGECFSMFERYIKAIPDIETRRKRVESYDKKISDLELKIDKAKAEKLSVETINRMIKAHNDLVLEQKSAIDRYDKAVAEQNDTFSKGVDLYNDYAAIIRSMTQDARLLEMLIHGK